MPRSSLSTLLWSLSLFSAFSRAGAINRDALDEETRCQDGSRGIVTHLQHYAENPFQPAIFTVDCGLAAGNHTHPSAEFVPKAKRATCASLGCSSACYGPGPSPTVADCNSLVEYLQNRGQQQSVASMQKVVVTSNSCLFRFTNNEYGAMELCDSTWASQSSSMAGQCLPQSPGTLCTASGFTLDVCVNSAYTPPTTSAPPTTSPHNTPLPTPNQQTTSNDSPATTPSNTATSTSSSIRTTASSNSTSKTTVSLSGTVEVTGLVVPAISLDSSSASATIAQALGYQGSSQSQSNIPAIVGAIFGALALALILVGVWLWRRRRARLQMEQMQGAGDASDFEQQDLASQIHPATSLPASPSTMVDRAAMPLVAGYGTTKLGFPRYPIAPVSDHSSSLNHLMSPTHDSASIPSTPATGTSMIDESPFGPPANGRPEFEGRPRSISARTLAQAIAPNLSQVDINRLADTIVARMQAGAPIVTPHGEVLSGQSELGEDPPPPFRASWNGSEQRTHAA